MRRGGGDRQNKTNVPFSFTHTHTYIKNSFLTPGKENAHFSRLPEPEENEAKLWN